MQTHTKQSTMNLFEAISKGEYKFNNVEYAATSTFSSIIGRYATYSGQTIKWDEALAANNSLLPERFAWDANPKLMPDEKGLYPIAMPGQAKVI